MATACTDSPRSAPSPWGLDSWRGRIGHRRSRAAGSRALVRAERGRALALGNRPCGPQSQLPGTRAPPGVPRVGEVYPGGSGAPSSDGPGVMPEPAHVWWTQVGGPALAQGDLLSACPIPLFQPDFDDDPRRTHSVMVKEYNCIIVTQSCDLDNERATLVALCPVFTLAEFEQEIPSFTRKGEWEQVRKGRVEGLHLLASRNHPADSRDSLAVDFRQIFSLPRDYLGVHAAGLGLRWRLNSPYLEHFSQAFARFFMRVGLPSSIPPFQ